MGRLDNKRFLYVELGGLTGRTLIGPQVIDFIKCFEEFGYSFDFISRGLESALFNWKIWKEKKKLKKLVKGKVYIIPAFPFRKLRIFLMAFFIYLIVFNDLIFKKKKIVVHARRHGAAEICLQLKKWHQNFIIISDLEGELGAEYEYLQKKGITIFLHRERKVKSKSQQEIDKKKAEFDRWEKNIIEKSDYILTVSNFFKKHLIKKHILVDDNKIYVFPSGADKKKFFFDPALRDKMRSNLGLDSKLVLVYLGNMHPWQLFPRTVEIFKKIKKMKSNAFLIVITPFKNKAKKIISDYRIDHRDYMIIDNAIGSNARIIPSFLCASDVGMLIRENNLVNNVASPGKFSEYLMCGLPVIMGNGIGDYSEIMRENENAIFLDDVFSDEELENKLRGSRIWELSNDNRLTLSEWAIRRFSKQVHFKNIEKIYNTI